VRTVLQPSSLQVNWLRSSEALSREVRSERSREGCVCGDTADALSCVPPTFEITAPTSLQVSWAHNPDFPQLANCAAADPPAACTVVANDPAGAEVCADLELPPGTDDEEG
jgi:hypothetical protein